MGPVKTRSAPALERALSMLEMLAESKNGLALPELARRLDLPKSSAHYLLVTLERCGYLNRNAETHRYMFGPKIFSVANMALSTTTLRAHATPFLHALMERTRLTVHMAILEQNQAVLIEKVEVPGTSKLATWPGRRMDVHCTGVGKALVAHLPEADLNRLIKEHGLPRHNENTLSSPRKLREELALVRKLSYAVDDQEDEIGLCCVGTAVFDREGRAIAAISVAGMTDQITTENLRFVAGDVQHAATCISEHLGFDAQAGAVLGAHQVCATSLPLRKT